MDIKDCLNRVINARAEEFLKELPEDSVDLVVTSPPYDDLRDYDGSVAWNDGVFRAVAGELYRVVKPGGVVVWVIGDKTENGGKTLTSFRQGLYFQELGFNMYDVIIYEKSGSGPPHPNRYFNTFEYMFVLSKGKPKTVHLLKDKPNKWAGYSTYSEVTRREKDGTLTNKGKKVVKEFGTRTNVWKYANGKGFSTRDAIAYEHPAIFPEKLAQDHILSWSDPGDIVLDPFSGSGTTAKMAEKLGRNWIMVDAVADYCRIAEKRLEAGLEKPANTVICRLPFEKTAELLEREYARLPEEGSFFAVCSTEYDKTGCVEHDFFDVISRAAAIGYQYVNTIVYPTKDVRQGAFADNVRYVVWLCKNRAEMAFNKDAVREKHIWKNVEWGKREKNYNPKGKDPGNVWIPTTDDGRANITGHILLSDSEVYARCAAMTGCGKNYRLIEQDGERGKTPPAKPAAPAPRGGRAVGKVIFGTSEKMDAVADGSVRAVITSPPYWNLKDYFKAGQIGQEPYDEYLRRMETVWAQCLEKLTPDGSLWINVNIRVQGGRPMLIPEDFVKICRGLGLYYKGIFIWHKSSGIPAGGKNLGDHHEYVLVFSKSRDFTVDREVQRSFADYKNDDINGGAFWNINRKAGSVGKKYIHPAIYPNGLVERIVKLATSPGDTVLDPFLGSGTTAVAALSLGRSCVGYEYYEGFRQLMESRFESELDGAEIEFSQGD